MITPKEITSLSYLGSEKNIFFVRPIGEHPFTKGDKKKIRKIIKAHDPSFFKKHCLERKSWKFFKSEGKFIIANNLTKHIFQYK